MAKIMLTLTILLLAPHALLAARIELQFQKDDDNTPANSSVFRAAAESPGAVTQQSEAESSATLSSVVESATSDSRDADDVMALASDAPVVTDHASTMQDVAEYALWILQKAMNGYTVYSQWNAVKLALNETALAAEEAEAAFWVLAEKVANSTIMFASSGLKDFAAQVNQGLVDRVAMEGMFDKHPENGEAEFLTAMTLFRSCTIELELIADTCTKVIQVIEGVKQLTAGVHELTDAMVTVDLTIFDTLSTQVDGGKHIIHGLVETAEREFTDVQQILATYMSGAWNHGMNIVDSQIQATFGDLLEEADAFQTVFEMVVRPLVVELAKAARHLADIAEEYTLPLDAPDSVTDETMNYYTGCSWRNSRIFDDIHDVDIEKTMSCEMVWWGRYKCTCIGTQDCYAGKMYRPEPSNIKRCFKEVW